MKSWIKYLPRKITKSFNKKAADILLYHRAFRIFLSSWFLVGHGIPKISSWFFDVQTWGPHIGFTPKNTFSGLAAIIELICPLLIILGIKIKWNAVIIAIMLAASAFALPFPWFHERIPVEGYALPFAVIVSKEMTFSYALAYFSLVFFAKNDDPIWRKR